MSLGWTFVCCPPALANLGPLSLPHASQHTDTAQCAHALEGNSTIHHTSHSSRGIVRTVDLAQCNPKLRWAASGRIGFNWLVLQSLRAFAGDRRAVGVYDCSGKTRLLGIVAGACAQTCETKPSCIMCLCCLHDFSAMLTAVYAWSF